jgi:transposase
MELTDITGKIFIATAKELKGSARRIFKARIVKALGKGGQRQAEVRLKWNRGTIRKGMRELESGFVCYDYFSGRGRKLSEAHLPNLLSDIKAIADAESQTDPTFKTTRLYIRLSAAAVRKQLIATKGYKDEVLPGEETIRHKLNKLGYRLKKVKKVNL